MNTKLFLLFVLITMGSSLAGYFTCHQQLVRATGEQQQKAINVTELVQQERFILRSPAAGPLTFTVAYESPSMVILQDTNSFTLGDYEHENKFVELIDTLEDYGYNITSTMVTPTRLHVNTGNVFADGEIDTRTTD